MPNPIASVSAFLNTLGVNTHSSSANAAYGNSSLVLNSLDYLGIDTVRDGFASAGTPKALLGAMAAAGIKFDFVVPSSQPATGNAGLADFVGDVAAFAQKYSGSVFAVEGLNEANIQAFSYNGDSSLAAAAAYQKALYTAVKGNSTLAGTKVINLSIAMESTADYATLGNLGAYSDYANAHAYTQTNQRADWVMQQSMDKAKGASKGDPTIITETGYTTLPEADGLGVNQTVQAKLTLASLLNAFENGSQKTFLYELFDSSLDPTGHQKERHFGLFNVDGTPKLAATAVHNFTTILGATDAGTGTPASAASAYSIGSMPTDGHATTLTKGNGAFDIMLWRDVVLWDDKADKEIAVAAKNVTIDLGGVQKTVYVYDPLNGTTPIATYTNVSSITVAMGDRPLIVEVGAKGPVSVTPPVVAPDLSMTAAQLVAQIDRLAGSTGLKTVTLSGSHVLQVSSLDTMKYMIAKYGSVLSKVQGGYSFLVESDGDGWKLETAYDAAGKLVSTTDYGMSGTQVANSHAVFTDGTVIDRRYTAGVLIQSITVAPDKTRTTKTYDATTGKIALDVVESPNGDVASTIYKNGVKTTYTLVHDDGSKVTDTFDATGLLTGEVLVDTAGTWTTKQYDAAGALSRVYIQRKDGSGENYVYGIKGQSYTSQHQVQDAKGAILSVARFHADGTLDYTELNGSDGVKTLANYDAQGRKLVEVRTTADGSRVTKNFDAATGKFTSVVEQIAGGATTTTTYDKGLVSAITTVRKDGSRTTQTFNAAGTMLTQVDVDSLNTWTTRTYNATSGALAKLFIQRADGSGENTSYGITGQSYVSQRQVTDTKGKVTYIERRHADGSLDYTSRYDSAGSQIVTTYNSVGKKIGEVTVELSGAKTTLTFDAVTGQVIKKITQSPTGFVKTYYYQNDVLVGVDDQSTDKVSYTYDASGRTLTKVVIDAAGTWTTTMYDPATGAATREYVKNADGSGATTLFGITGQNYVTERQVFDAAGRVVAVTRTRADGSTAYSQVTAADGSSTVDTFAADGTKLTEVRTATDGSRTSETYDATTGKIVSQIVVSGGATVTTAYKNGVVDTVTTLSVDGVKTTSAYDASGKKLSEVVVDKAGVWTTSIFDADGALSRQYVKRTDGSGENFAYGLTGKTYVAEHTVFDAKGKVTLVSRTHADGSLDYNEVNNADGSRVLDTYDAAGRKLTQLVIGADGGRATFSYDVATGYLVRQVGQPANGDVVTTTYVAGVMTARRNQQADGGKVLETFAADGSKTMDSYSASNVKLRGIAVDAVGTWTTSLYDATGKLAKTFVERADGSGENSVFNITGTDYSVQTQSVSATGKVTAVKRTRADGSLVYTEANAADGSRSLLYYDAKGRKTTDVEIAPDGTRSTSLFDVASGAVTKLIVEAKDGPVTTTIYAGRVVASIVTQNPDGSRITDTYDARGTKLSEVLVDAGGTWTSLVFDATTGDLARKYVTNADGTGDVYSYGVTGQTYVTEHQVLGAGGAVVSATRTNAGGVTVYSMAVDASGTKTSAYFDATGRQQSEVVVAKGGTRTTLIFDTAKGLVLSGTVDQPDGTKIASTYTNSVLTQRVTTAADGTKTTEAFSSAGHDLTAVKALSGYDAILVDNGGHALRGSGASEILLADAASSTTSLLGDAGDDRFVVARGGSATIADFGFGHDLLDLSAFAKAGYQPTIALSGQDAVLRYGTGETITLTGIDPKRLASVGGSTSGVYELA